MALRVLTAGSTLHGVRPCAEAFAQVSGAAVEVATDHGHSIRDAVLRGGSDADVVLLPADMAAALIAAGRAAPDMVPLGAVPIAAAVPADTPVPGVATLAALTAALRAASQILLTRAPTGDHMRGVIARLGLDASDRIAAFDTSTLLMQHLAERGGRGALGFSPATEIVPWVGRGAAMAGPIPTEVQVALPYVAAVLTQTARPATARAFLAHLATAPARQAFAESGMSTA